MMYPINYSASKSYKNITAMVIEPMEKVAGNSVLHGQAVTAFADEDGTMVLNGGLMFMLQGPKSELERLLKDVKALRERVKMYLAETDEMEPAEAEEIHLYTIFGLMLDNEPAQSVERCKKLIIDGARIYHTLEGGYDPVYDPKEMEEEGERQVDPHFQKFIDTILGIEEKEIYYAERMEVDDALRECGQMPYEE